MPPNRTARSGVFRLPRDIQPAIRQRLLRALSGAEGQPVRISLRPSPTAYRGRLLSGGRRGASVHGGTFLRKRRIVLDTELLGDPQELARILIHEVFHFVWLKLGNPGRCSFEAILRDEIQRGARGELGWSAEIRKRGLSPQDWRNRSRRWREYVCEGFCDTAAWLYSGVKRHEEFTLAPTFRQERERWFRNSRVSERISV